MVNMRMSDDEVAMLKRLAETEERSASDLVRQLIRKAHDERWKPIWIRRGIFPPCSKTFTILPHGWYSQWHFRLAAVQRLVHELRLEQGPDETG